jgi:hypothetical protein
MPPRVVVSTALVGWSSVRKVLGFLLELRSQAMVVTLDRCLVAAVCAVCVISFLQNL